MPKYNPNDYIKVKENSYWVLKKNNLIQLTNFVIKKTDVPNEYILLNIRNEESQPIYISNKDKVNFKKLHYLFSQQGNYQFKCKVEELMHIWNLVEY